MKNKQYLGFLLFLIASGCASASDDPDCSLGQRSCDQLSNNVMTCGVNGWEIAEACKTGTVCNALTLRCEQQSNVNVCTSGARTCSTDGTQVLLCSDNNWTLDKTCGNDEQCDSIKLTCEKKPVSDCVDGTRSCSTDGSLVQVCSGGRWSVEKTCGTDERCDSNYQCSKTSTTDCVEGTKKCEGDTVMLCKNGVYNVIETCVSPSVCVSSSGSCEIPRVCNPGEKKCDTDLSRVVLCSDEGSWVVFETCDTLNGASCDAATLACRKGCDENATRCDADNRFLKCQGNTWEAVKSCKPEESCDNSLGCLAPAECADLSQKCANETGYYICNAGKWSTSVTKCDANENCINGNCVAQEQCTEDVCRNGNAVSCKSGVESVVECGAKNCIIREGKAICEDHVCDDGQFKCDSDSEKSICSDNKWIKTNCDSGFVCDISAKGCIEHVCDDSEKRCKDNVIEMCAGNAWHSVTPCGTTQMCDDSSTTCIPINCNNGDKRCNNGNVEKCSNNAYSSDQTCSSNQICSQPTSTTASCVDKVCNEGEYKCDGLKLQKCTGNAWKPSQTCNSATQLCKASGTTGTCETKVCDEGATKCDNNTNSVMVCQDNAWKLTPCKNNEYCDKDNSDYKCVEKECENGAICDGSTLKICTNYHYSYTQPCLGNFKCNASKAECEFVPECSTGQYKCIDSTLYSCSGGLWSENKTCAGENEVCDASKGKCVDTSECTTGEYYCDGKILKECKSGKWTDKTTCKDTETCNATTKKCELTPVCTEGEVTCNGQILRTCDSSGQWKDKTCDEGQTCDASLKKCRECTSGYQCRAQDKGYQVYECKEGSWVTRGSDYYCNSQYTCDAEIGRCTQCYGSEYTCHGFNLMQCSNYKWTTNTECGMGTHCDASKPGCVSDAVCTSGYTCVGQDLKECKSGQWEPLKTCKDTETCNATTGKCDLKPVCTPGATECDGNTLKTCNASGQWDTTPCGDSKVCVTSGSSSSCVNKIALPEWCNIQGIDIINHGYGRVLMPASVNTDDITAKFVCGKVSTPVMSWTYASEAVVNTGCTHEDGCDPNTEFISYSMNAPVGSYQCTYRFEFGPQTIACLPRIDDDNNGGAPIVLDSSTKLTAAQTMPLTLIAASTEAPEWCWFKHFDTKEYGSTWKAYGRILPPNPTSPAQIKAMLICGDVTKPASTWTVKRDAKENLFCNDCAAGHYEYASAPLFDTPEPSANYVCAFRMDVAGKSYVCPTRNDGPGAEGGTPVELTSGLVLPEGTYWGY